jgi:hypothetical protein
MAGRGPNGRSMIIKRDDGRWHGYVSMGSKATAAATVDTYPP